MSTQEPQTGAAPANKTNGKATTAADLGLDTAKMKDKFNVFKDKVTTNAAAFNEQVARNAAQLRDRMGAGDSDDDDDESSDEEVEELLFGTSTTTGGTTTIAATATTERSQMPPSFISLEEEERVKTQLKAAKTLRKRLRKLKKLTSNSLKTTQEATNRLDKLLIGINLATEGPCTDPGIQKLASTSAENIKAFRDKDAFETYKTRVTAEVGDRMKPLMDHAKYLSIVGKERRQARDKRIQLERGELNVADEAAYLRSVDIVKDFDDKSEAYKDEFRSLVEHNSSQVGHMLKNFLLESATYYEDLAKVLRASADSVATTSNQYMTTAAVEKFKNYEAPRVEPLITAPALFSAGNGNTRAVAAPTDTLDDRLTTKPTARLRDEVVTGIPLTETGAVPQPPPRDDGYGISRYTRRSSTQSADDETVSRTRMAVNEFLNTGRLPASSTPKAGDAAQSSPPKAPKPVSNSMRDIRYLEDMYGIEWPGTSAKTRDEEDLPAAAASTRSLTPTDNSILPSIMRPQSNYYGSGLL